MTARRAHRSNIRFRMAAIHAIALLLSLGCAPDRSLPGGLPEPLVIVEASAFPASGATEVALDTELRIRLSGRVDASSAGRGLTLEQLGDDGGPVSGTVLLAGAGDQLVFVPREPLVASRRYRARVLTALRDAFQRPLARGGAWEFETGARSGAVQPRPVLAAMVPVEGAIEMSIHVRPELRFSHVMDPASLVQAVRLETAEGAPVAARVDVDPDGRRARLLPAVPLSLSTRYRLRVSTEAAALGGLALAAETSSTFTTSADPTRGAPLLVESTLPADGDSDVGPGTRLVVRFSRPLLTRTVSASTFHLRTAAGAAVDGRVYADELAGTATFMPAARLAPGGAYVAAVEKIYSDENIQLESPHEWRFTVSTDPLRGERPEVVQTTPIAGTEGVTADTVVQVRFSKAIAPGTVSAETARVRVDGEPVAAVRTMADERTLTVRPLDPVDDAEYGFELTEGVRDLEGLPLKAFSFAVRTARDTEPPRVRSTVPVEGAIDVALNAPIRLTLSEPSAAPSLSVGVEPGGAALPVTLSEEEAGTQLVIRPGDTWPPLVSIIAKVVGLRDARGNLAPEFTLRFRTGAGADTTPPSFAGLATVTPLGETSAALAWSEALDEGGGPVTYLAWSAPSPGPIDFGATPVLTTTSLSATVEGLTGGSSYFFAVRAQDPSGNVDGNLVERAATMPDLTPPAFPGRLSVAPIAGRAALALTWPAASDAVTSDPDRLKYRVYAAQTSGGQQFQPSGRAFETADGALEAELLALPPEPGSTEPQPLVGGRRYYVVVRAVDEAGNESTNTAEASAVVADTQPPVFTGAVRAAARSRTSVRVEWSAASDDLTAPAALRYRVESRRAAPGEPLLAQPLVTGLLALDVAGLSPGERYVFRVTALDGAGNEAVNPNETEVQLDASPPEFPAGNPGLSVSSPGPGQATLSWSRATDDATPQDGLQYLVFRSQAQATLFAATPDVVPGTVTQRSFAGLGHGAWFFGVRARDAVGNSEANVASASLTLPPTYADVRANVLAVALDTASCLGCHSTGLDYASLLSRTASSCGAPRLVVPGAPADSYLYAKIGGGGAVCGSVMPPGRALSAAQRDLVRDWILGGALGP
jgi:hypothetical protein